MSIRDWLTRLATGTSRPPAGGSDHIGADVVRPRSTVTITRDRELGRTIASNLADVASPHTVRRNPWTASMAFATGGVELVLVDWRLPPGHRGRIVSAVRDRDDGNPAPSLVALVPDGSPGLLSEIVDEPVDDHVPLPLDVELLRSRIVALDQRRQDDRRRRERDAMTRRQLELLRLVSDAEGDVLWQWYPDTDEFEASTEWSAWIGDPDGVTRGTLEDWLSRVHPEDAQRLRDILSAVTGSQEMPFDHRFRLRHADGEWRWTLVRGRVIRPSATVPRRLVGLQTDLSRRQLTGIVPVSVAQDPLTGLPTRGLMIDRLEHALFRARRDESRGFAVLFFDVDRFKNINDSLGHLKGDQLLRQIAERVRGACRPSDTVARFGGDEFVVIVEDLPDLRSATHAAERLLHSFRVPFDLDGIEVFVTVSIGIAYWNADYDDPEEIVRDADTAMYRAKTNGRNRFAVFDEAMHAHVVATLQLENDLRRALSRSEFRAYYQPIVTLDDGQIAGFEVLARWEHPERGLLLPASFIPVAEEMGTIIQLDRSIIEQGSNQLRTWQQAYRRTPPLYLSVNVSSTQFNQTDLVPHIDMTLRKAGLYGRSLTIEVTESVLMENAAHALDMLEQLRQLDIGISIDDFGTGYSSLAYLRRFGIDTLKIDHSFVSRMLQDEDSSEIVRTICTLARNLGKRTVAEGVETRSQLEALRELGIDHVQGNFVAPALTGVEASSLLERTWKAPNQLEKILDDRRSGVSVHAR